LPSALPWAASISPGGLGMGAHPTRSAASAITTRRLIVNLAAGRVAGQPRRSRVMVSSPCFSLPLAAARFIRTALCAPSGAMVRLVPRASKTSRSHHAQHHPQPPHLLGGEHVRQDDDRSRPARAVDTNDQRREPGPDVARRLGASFAPRTAALGERDAAIGRYL